MQLTRPYRASQGNMVDKAADYGSSIEAKGNDPRKTAMSLHIIRVTHQDHNTFLNLDGR